MRTGTGCILASAVWCLLAPTAAAADREVRLLPPGQVARDLMGFPRIADPVDDAERKINVALARLDETIRQAVEECRPGTPGRATRQRMFSVPVSAPGFLSFHFVDYTHCGAAQPDYATAAIVYDLRSGAPVDWTKLLPPALAGEVSSSETSEGTTVATLSSARLHRLYLKHYRPRTGGAKPDAADEECRKAVARMRDGRPPRMVAWFEGGAGLAVHFDLPQATEACADDVTISIATLRSEGASADLLRALEAARPARLR